MSVDLDRFTIARAVYSVDPATGLPAGGGSTASPMIIQSQGAGSFATGQTASSVSPAAAAQVVPARAGRQAVTVSNVTGTQPVYFLTSAAITGVTTGLYLPAGVGAAMTIPTSAAVFATSPTAAQTLSFLETF